MTRRAPLALLLLLVSGVASAQRRLAVVELDAPPNMTGLSAEVMSIVTSESQAQGFTLVAPDELRQSLGEGPYEELRKCGPQPACVAARVNGKGVDRVVLGKLGRDEKNYLVKLWLVTLSPSPALAATVDRPILIAGRRFHQDVAGAVPGFLRGEHEAVGTLDLRNVVAGAAVTVDGEARGATPLELQLKPGKHELVLEKSGYLPMRRLFTVEPSQRLQDDIQLIRVPGGEDSRLPAAHPGSQLSAQPEKHSAVRVPVGGWVCLGVSAAATAVGIYFGAASEKLERKVELSFDRVEIAYNGTRADAIKARSGAQTANFFFAGAGAALVAGAVWTLIDHGQHDAPPVQASVGVAQSSGFVSIAGRF